MNLTKRMITYNVATLVIPLVITIAAAFVFMFVSKTIFGVEIGNDGIKRLADVNYELFTSDSSLFQKDAERLLDKEYQKLLTAKLAANGLDLIIMKNDEVILNLDNYSKIEIEKCLKAAKGNLINTKTDLDKGSYFVKMMHITFKDGGTGNVVLLTEIKKSGAATLNLLIFCTILFIGSFLLVNLAFARVMSEKVTRPLAKLHAATQSIAAGNLDEAIVEHGDEEIRSLCHSFEQMRLQLKESIQERMKLDDNRKMLISSISHDLKTPITSIKGYVEGILDNVANTQEKRQKYLKTIYSKTNAIDMMVDDLLLYSRLDLKQLPFNFEKTDIYKYFEDCVLESQHDLQYAGHCIDLLNELPKPVFVMMDRGRIRRVVTNIMDNANKYMNKPNGMIHITLRQTEASIIIEFRDNGGGISKDDLRQIFDRFYRADKARSNVKGSGLGLAICKQIVEGHEGKIWAKSVIGEGTSILISLKKQMF